MSSVVNKFLLLNLRRFDCTIPHSYIIFNTKHISNMHSNKSILRIQLNEKTKWYIIRTIHLNVSDILQYTKSSIETHLPRGGRQLLHEWNDDSHNPSAMQHHIRGMKVNEYSLIAALLHKWALYVLLRITQQPQYQENKLTYRFVDFVFL